MLCTAEMTYEHARLCIAINFKIEYWLLPSLFFLPPLLLSPAPSLLSPGLPIHCPSSHNRRTERTKKQYTSTFRNFVPNLPVSAILV